MANPNNRPYNPNQLQELVQQMKQGGPVISPPELPEPTIVHEANFEHYPRRFDQAKLATSGLFRVFSPEVRAQRRQDKVQELEKREKVVDYVGQRISNPRRQTNPIDPARIGWVGGPMQGAGEKIGWVGTHTRESGGSGRAEDAANMGYSLFKQPPGGPAQPNLLRPATRSEERASQRLEAKIVKARKLRGESRWLSDSYGHSLNRGTHRLSRAEAKHMRRVSKRIEKLDKRAGRKERKFEKVAASKDIRGVLSHKKLAVRKLQAEIGSRRSVARLRRLAGHDKT